MDENAKITNAKASQTPESDQTRRAALARMGRLAGYTAPLMLALLGATKARAQANGSEGGCGACG